MYSSVKMPKINNGSGRRVFWSLCFKPKSLICPSEEKKTFGLMRKIIKTTRIKTHEVVLNAFEPENIILCEKKKKRNF